MDINRCVHVHTCTHMHMLALIPQFNIYWATQLPYHILSEKTDFMLSVVDQSSEDPDFLE